MKIIALTSANENAMRAASEQLLDAAATRKLQLTVMQGIQDAHQANSIYCGGGELWRIGHDESRPELDPLVDRWIDDSSSDQLAQSLGKALDGFIGKTQVAA